MTFRQNERNAVASESAFDTNTNPMEFEVSHNKYAALYDLAPAGYLILDANGFIKEINQAGKNLFGVKRTVSREENFNHYIAPEFKVLFTQHLEKALKEMISQTVEIKLLKHDNTICFAKLNTRAILTKTHEPLLLVIATDISARKEAEKQLHQKRQKIALTDRIIAIEELATTIAQEINQPLAAISNYIHGSVRRLESGSVPEAELLQALRQAAKQSERTAEVIRELKSLFSKKSFFYEPACLNILMNESISLIQYELAEFPLAIFFRPSNDIPNLILDKIHIQQVILNIARNSIQLMRAANTQEPTLTIEIKLKNNSSVEIMISDNSPGIDDEKLHELFNPSFPSESATLGLGLGVSRSIVEAHGGDLQIKSRPQKSVQFKFSLARNILSPNSS